MDDLSRLFLIEQDMAAKKKKFDAAAIDAKRRRYDPDEEGYGSPEEWRDAFQERMGFDEAQRVVGSDKPRDILDVGLRATWDEIKRAYRKLVLKWHPDRIAQTGVDPITAEKELKRVNAAFAVLAKEFGK